MANKVTPRAGVWIEIVYNKKHYQLTHVTPRAGVWIEIGPGCHKVARRQQHSPCGSVD